MPDEDVDPELEEFLARATEDDLQIVLGLIGDGVRDYGNPAYYGDDAKRDHLLVPGVAAACRNCHIVARATRLAAERPGFLRVKPERNRITLILRDNLQVWFKKVDKRGKPSHRPSRQSRAYLTPYEPEASQTQLLDAPKVMQVVGGYRPIEGTADDWEVVVSGRRKAGGWWQAPLFAGEIQQLATAPAPAVAELVRSRVQIRDRGTKKTGGTDNGA